MKGEKQKHENNSVSKTNKSQPGKSCLNLPSGEWYRRTSLLVSLTLSAVVNTALLAIACLCLGSFHLYLFTMASDNFIISPIPMIISSALSLLLAITGVIALLKKRTYLFLMLGVLSFIMFFLQIIAVIFSFLLVENVLTDLAKVNVDEQLGQAVSDNSTRAVWDSIQTQYKCCGGRGNKGFNEWEAFLNGTYPDSCCTIKYPVCGRQAHRTLGSDFAISVYDRIHAQGCLTAVQQSLEESVNPLLMAWGVAGVAVALAELVVVFMCLLFTLHSSKSQDLGIGIPHQPFEGEFDIHLFYNYFIVLIIFCVLSKCHDLDKMLFSHFLCPSFYFTEMIIIFEMNNITHVTIITNKLKTCIYSNKVL